MLLTSGLKRRLVGKGTMGLVIVQDNVVPAIPSEVVTPLAGFLIQQGKLQLLPTLCAGSIAKAWL